MVFYFAYGLDMGLKNFTDRLESFLGCRPVKMKRYAGVLDGYDLVFIKNLRRVIFLSPIAGYLRILV